MRGKLYDRDGRSGSPRPNTATKDRVVVKSDGNYTYLAPDIAYHAYKFERGFTRLVNVLPPITTAIFRGSRRPVAALGHRANQLDWCAGPDGRRRARG